jgi:hypothetical protein
MRAFVCMVVAALSIVIPWRDVCQAIGDLGIEVERVSETMSGVDKCGYCGRFISAGRVHQDAPAVIKGQLQTALTNRDMGYVIGKARGQYINVLIYRYEERQGGDYAVDKPARVGFHMHLMNKGTVKRVFVYEEDQQALMENLFNIGKFMRRGGKWVTAERLSDDGINKGIDNLLEVIE